MKSITFWGNSLCDYSFQLKIYPILRRPDYMIILSSQKPISFWGSWLCDCILRNEIYPILRRPDSVLIFSSQKLITFWGDLTMWLYFPVKNLSQSEGTWLCDYTFQPKKYPILRVTDYVIILSSQKPISFWGSWLCDCILRNEIYNFLRKLTMWL